MLPVVLLRILRAVLAAGVPPPRRLALDLLARALRVVRRRVLDDVLEVEERAIVAGAAVGDVLLAVARADHVVAILAAQRVAERVVRPVDVGPRERPQVIVAGAAGGRIAAAVGEDRVVAR